MNIKWMLDALQDMQTFAAMNNLWDSYAALQTAKEIVSVELEEIQAYQAKHAHTAVGFSNSAKNIFLPPFKK